MATSRVVNTNFWRDTYVTELDPTEKYLFIYFITNPNTNMAGAYEINLKQAALDTGIDLDMIKRILERFCLDEKMYYERGYLVLRNFIKHQRLNPSIKVGIEKAISELPEWLRTKIIRVEDENKQLSLLVETKHQSGDSLPTDSPQYKEKKLKEKKTNAPTAPELLHVDSELAAKEASAKRRVSDQTISTVREELEKKGILKARVIQT